MDTHKRIDAEVLACLKDALRWLDAIDSPARLKGMPYDCRIRATMRAAVELAEQQKQG